MNYVNRALELLCKDEPCYLQVPGVCIGGTETTVPCHSNQLADGHGMGIKAHSHRTVPGCSACHKFIDQQRRDGREEATRIFEDAYRRWDLARWSRGLVTVAGGDSAYKRFKPEQHKRSKLSSSKVIPHRGVVS